MNLRYFIANLIFLLLFQKRPTIIGTSLNKELDLTYSQSQNSSAKIALIVNDNEAKNYEIINKGRDTWNKFDNSFFTTHLGIAVEHYSFYFRMLKNVVDRMTDAGVMAHLMKTKLFNTRSYPKPESEPNVLNIDDLLFGFNIWAGFCGISGFAFVIETILGIKSCRKILIFDYLKKRFKFKKVKFAKVHQSKDLKCSNCSETQGVKSEMLQKIRIKKSDQVTADVPELSPKEVVTVHHRMNSELELKIFGPKVLEEQSSMSSGNGQSNNTNLCQFEQEMDEFPSEKTKIESIPANCRVKADVEPSWDLIEVDLDTE